MRCYFLVVTLKHDNALSTSYFFLCLFCEVQMFLSALVDVAGHARRADAAFEIMKDARAKGLHVGIIAYSSLMGACCNVSSCINCWMKSIYKI